MQEVKVKIKKYAKNATNVNIVDNSDLEKKILNFIYVSFGALALCYVLVLASMIYNIIERKGLEAEARTLQNEIGDLELVYLSKTDQINLNLSRSLGFVEMKPNFATRGSVASTKIALNEI